MRRTHHGLVAFSNGMWIISTEATKYAQICSMGINSRELTHWLYSMHIVRRRDEAVTG